MGKVTIQVHCNFLDNVRMVVQFRNPGDGRRLAALLEMPAGLLRQLFRKVCVSDFSHNAPNYPNPGPGGGIGGGKSQVHFCKKCRKRAGAEIYLTVKARKIEKIYRKKC